MIKWLSLSVVASTYAVSAFAMAPMKLVAPQTTPAIQKVIVTPNEPITRPDVDSPNEPGMPPETFENPNGPLFKVSYTAQQDNDQADEIACRKAQDAKDNQGVMDNCNPEIVQAYFNMPSSEQSFERMVIDSWGNDLRFLLQKTAFDDGCNIKVDLSSQRLTYNDGTQTYGPYPISSARAGYYTPTGRYSIYLFDKGHKSHKYNNSPMPFAMFFKGGWAIHGTYDKGLGTPHSHGCVRMNPAQAGLLYSRMQATGGRTVCITGNPPIGRNANPKPVDDDAAPAPTTRRHKKPVPSYDEDQPAPAPAPGYGYEQPAPRENCGLFGILGGC